MFCTDSVQVLGLLTHSDASIGCARWRVTGGGVLEVIVLIAEAWRLD